jgi:hypothetical protein
VQAILGPVRHTSCRGCQRKHSAPARGRPTLYKHDPVAPGENTRGGACLGKYP